MQMEGLVEKRRCQTNASPRPMSCWVHATADDERCTWLIEEDISSEAKKKECKVALSGEEREFWMGTEAGMLGVYNFQGMILGGEWVQGSAAYIGVILLDACV